MHGVGKAEDAFGLCIAWYGVSIAGWQAVGKHCWCAILYTTFAGRAGMGYVWCFVALQLRFLYTAYTA